jgi:outer membrane protein W
MKQTCSFVLVLLASVLVAPAARSQDEGFWLGIKAGYGLTKPDIDIGFQILKGKDASGGLVAGLTGEGYLSENISVEAELNYSRRQVKNTYDGGTGGGTYLGDVTADYTFEYLESAISLKWTSSNDHFRPYGLIGVIFSVPLKIESSNTFPGTDPYHEDAKRQFVRASWAADVGLGIDYRISPRTCLLLEGRFLYPLSNSAASPVDTWKWKDYRLLAGVRFRI